MSNIVTLAWKVLAGVSFFAWCIGVRAEPTPMQTPRHPFEIAGICSMGFEDAIHRETSVQYEDPQREKFCDIRSLCGFKIAAGIPCDELLPGEGYDDGMISRYDLDKNGKVECVDYLAWKRWIADEFESGKRKSSGENLFVAECEQAHKARDADARE